MELAPGAFDLAPAVLPMRPANDLESVGCLAMVALVIAILLLYVLFHGEGSSTDVHQGATTTVHHRPPPRPPHH